MATKANCITVCQAVDAFLDHRRERTTPNTYRTYAFWLKRWLNWREECKKPMLLHDVTMCELKYYFISMEEESLKPASRDATWRVLRAMWRLLTRRGLITHEQSMFFGPDGIARIVVPPTIQPIYQRDEIQSLIAACDKIRGKEYGALTRVVVYLLWESGGRANEICSLTDERTQLENRRGVIDGKGGIPRWIRWDEECAVALSVYLKIRSGTEGGPLLRGSRGQKLNPNAMRLMLRRLAKLAGVDLVAQSPIHAFRRTFAQDCLDGGIADLELQQLMGHRSIVSTQIYSRRSPERLDEVYKRVRRKRH